MIAAVSHELLVQDNRAGGLLYLMLAFVLSAIAWELHRASVEERERREAVEAAESDEFIGALRDESAPFVVDGVAMSPALRDDPQAAQRVADRVNGVRTDVRGTWPRVTADDVATSLGVDGDR